MAGEQSNLISFPAMEEKCGECTGVGAVGEEPFRFACENCEGTGFLLTSFGEEVFAFIEHAARRYRYRHGAGLHFFGNGCT